MLLLLAAIAACGGGTGPVIVESEVEVQEPKSPRPTLPPPAPAPRNDPPPPSGPLPLTITFTDVTTAAGLTSTDGYKFLTGYEGQDVSGGAAAGDYDDDGDLDLCTIGGDEGKMLLYRNKGDGTFEEVGKSAGIDISSHKRSGPSFADYDSDGDLDLFIGGMDGTAPVLFRNKGDGTFEDVTSDAKLDITRTNTFSAAWGDYDEDGDIDLILAHWSGGDSTNTSQVLWRNKGDGTFEDVSDSAGISAVLATVGDYMLAPNFSDIDADGDMDLLFTSDFGTSQVLKNNGDGTFTRTTDTDVITDTNGMGPSIGDYDNDGDLDWFVTSIWRDSDQSDQSGNRFYRNDGNGVYTDVTTATKTRAGGWGWASSFMDFDNDGWLDIFHVNGWGQDPEKPVLFMSQRNGSFHEYAGAAGLAVARQGRGIVCFDYDDDGDIDILVSSWPDEEPRLYRNDGGDNKKWLQVKLKGSGDNTGAAGAWVKVTAGGITQLREVRLGTNYVSQNPLMVHFGLASSPIATTVKVEWPDKSTSTLTNVAADQRITIEQD
jgi:hypothetical protein